MRIYAIADKDIPKDEYNEVIQEVKNHYEKHTDLSVKVETEFRDLSDLSFEYYRKGSRGVSRKYLKQCAKEVNEMTGEKAHDYLALFVVSDKWVPSEDGIWGWNIAGATHGLETQQCRFDTVSEDKRSRVVNSVGTFFHETMHAVDQFVYRLTGKVIRRIVQVDDWDDDVVHGESEEWQYIRYKENVQALRKINVALTEAFTKRMEQYERELQLKKLGLMERLLEFLRDKLNKVLREDKSIYKVDYK